MTVSHACRSSWRNSRAVGYHGLSVRLSIQRQHGTYGIMIHVGLPIEAARCATAVSALITRSSVSMIAAVWAKSSSCGCKSKEPAALIKE